MVPVTVASLAAIAIQPLIAILWILGPSYLAGLSVSAHSLGEVSGWVVLFAAAFVLILGLPAFLVLRRFDRVTARNLGAAGFLIASIPFAALGWPGYPHPGYSAGGNWHGRPVEFVVDGVTTVYGWLHYVEGVFIYGVHGLTGALVFLFVWRRLKALTNGSSGRAYHLR